jgi:hypothetical protein
MKAILLILSLIIATHSFADCRKILSEEELDLRYERDESAKMYSTYGAGATLGLLFVNPIFSAGLFSIFITDLAVDTIKTEKRAKMIQLIDEAYEYNETYRVGSLLERIFRKVNRQSDKEISLDQVADGIIKANKNKQLCSNGKRNVRKVSKVLAISL